ncbi:bacillithiol system protein YtxJ [Bernardetia litoralis DSM 6794]|uniref:Bacillithiol system protein YtxJ n=1 Tax=Bernardetia litoralis (strain ATCC 23117 / DSM 6794 / NBRC 15988 / NCIMB 1366 / Fx l1 / Sio-4) TaxID=880071 RepID=I4APY9_BERLS|nr:bacillithiol system protein YtxJ [Bernardetia litoralis DSM 6794]
MNLVTKFISKLFNEQVMNWNKLETPETLQEIIKNSDTTPVLIFKHSTRCSISTMALSRFERQWNQEKMGNVEPYYLDLIKYKNISNLIAQELKITHESPQVLLVKNGKCIYNASHSSIYFDDLVGKAS